MIHYLAASPTQTVDTSGRICLIVSNIAIPTKRKSKHIIFITNCTTKINTRQSYLKKPLPAVTDPPGEFTYMTISCLK